MNSEYIAAQIEKLPTADTLVKLRTELVRWDCNIDTEKSPLISILFRTGSEGARITVRVVSLALHLSYLSLGHIGIRVNSGVEGEGGDG